MLALFDGLRGLGEEVDVDKEIQDAIEQIPTRPEWATASEDERAATMKGLRDASGGVCQ